jgi:hypothetical protein
MCLNLGHCWQLPCVVGCVVYRRLGKDQHLGSRCNALVDDAYALCDKVIQMRQNPAVVHRGVWFGEGPGSRRDCNGHVFWKSTYRRPVSMLRCCQIVALLCFAAGLFGL